VRERELTYRAHLAEGERRKRGSGAREEAADERGQAVIERERGEAWRGSARPLVGRVGQEGEQRGRESGMGSMGRNRPSQDGERFFPFSLFSSIFFSLILFSFKEIFIYS
jgi:hypothetical protein